MATGDLAPTRLYLDIDGVIMPFEPEQSPFEIVRLNPIEIYAPEVASRLRKTGAEIVWLTSWEEQSARLGQQIPDFANTRYLSLPDGPDWLRRKLAALQAEQAVSPSPFVWADDKMTSAAKKVASGLEVPNLILHPDKNPGLSEAELSQIESFVQMHRL